MIQIFTLMGYFCMLFEIKFLSRKCQIHRMKCKRSFYCTGKERKYELKDESIGYIWCT